MTLTKCLHTFFSYYLPQIKGGSPQTLEVYKKSFELFLLFAARHKKCSVQSLQLEHLSTKIVIAFLQHLEQDRHNSVRTRNLRLAAIKSLARMIRLLYPEYREYADNLRLIPQKRAQKKLIGYLYQDEILQVLATVDLKRKEGMRDYAILHLLFDSGARAAEVANLHLDYFDQQNKTLAILGKGNRFRQIILTPKTVDLLQLYIEKHRSTQRYGHKEFLFVNQRLEHFTRHGINRLCKKYLSMALPAKRVEMLSPAHSFRHSCAMNMLIEGAAITDIQNRLGHASINSTMVYLKMETHHKRDVQKQFLQYTQSILSDDPKITEIADWEDKDEILSWLDNL
ncbi:MAG: integrase [Desulfocapsa sp.]|nr:MAG: integrase [Desulfocapsa sp.]